MALPQGGSVVSGNVTISNPAATFMRINQATDRAIINWNSFSIGNGETTQFIQPNTTSAALNRVTGGNLSAIYGTLNANGRIYLVNPNGVLIGSSGLVNTSGFLASTLDVSNSAFMAGGDMIFKGDSTSEVKNLGTINSNNGDVYLIAQKVTNSGSINVSNGKVALVAGKPAEGEDLEVLLKSADGQVFIRVKKEVEEAEESSSVSTENEGSEEPTSSDSSGSEESATSSTDTTSNSDDTTTTPDTEPQLEESDLTVEGVSFDTSSDSSVDDNILAEAINLDTVDETEPNYIYEWQSVYTTYYQSRSSSTTTTTIVTNNEYEDESSVDSDGVIIADSVIINSLSAINLAGDIQANQNISINSSNSLNLNNSTIKSNSSITLRSDSFLASQSDITADNNVTIDSGSNIGLNKSSITTTESFNADITLQANETIDIFDSTLQVSGENDVSIVADGIGLRGDGLKIVADNGSVHIGNDRPIESSPVIIGGGTVVIDGTNNYSGGTIIDAGSLILNPDVTTPDNLNLNSGGGQIGGIGGIPDGSPVTITGETPTNIPDFNFTPVTLSSVTTPRKPSGPTTVTTTETTTVTTTADINEPNKILTLDITQSSSLGNFRNLIQGGNISLTPSEVQSVEKAITQATSRIVPTISVPKVPKVTPTGAGSITLSNTSTTSTTKGDTNSSRSISIPTTRINTPSVGASSINSVQAISAVVNIPEQK